VFIFHPFQQAVGVNANPTLKLVLADKFSPESRHVLDLGIKKVITPTFVSLRPNKWFNDHYSFP
jgi:hypothetical protein